MIIRIEIIKALLCFYFFGRDCRSVDEYSDLLKKLTIPASISLMAGLARFVFSDNKSLLTFLRGMFIAGFVGMMTGYGLQDAELSEGMKGLIIGASSFCADEVLMIVLKFAAHVKKDPMKYVREYLKRR